jgi:hypothetical protein
MERWFFVLWFSALVKPVASGEVQRKFTPHQCRPATTDLASVVANLKTNVAFTRAAPRFRLASGYGLNENPRPFTLLPVSLCHRESPSFAFLSRRCERISIPIDIHHQPSTI